VNKPKSLPEIKKMFNKSKSKRNYRSRKQQEQTNEESEETKQNENEDDVDGTEEGEEEESVLTSLQERKELQSFRKRQTGVSAESLLVGEKVEQKKDGGISDPFKIKSGGGLTEMSATAKKVTQVSELGTAFSTETNQRDEDVQLLKYIEEGLKKKRGADEETTSNNEMKLSSKESQLFQVPDNINVKSKIMKSEEMLSSQMLSGIPEVNLGIEAKIKNIEATEEAKMKMIDDSKNKRRESSDFVPTNMASNFMHHNRFYNEKAIVDKERKKEQKKKELESVTVVDKGPTVGKEIVENDVDTKFMNKAMNASQNKRKDKPSDTVDDYMFENFKKKAKEGRWR